ncbi:MAG: type II secretion system F family protein [Pirellulaceae bacterium]|jgi:tight adherence protein B|nr:type II secretion system F family protein [Pirellulaceae bacterium]MDP7017829.1 type II secretion system F family protein [Pirellulaceae bacterium]
MLALIVVITCFVAVAALVAAVGTLMRPDNDAHIEDRLDLLTGAAQPVEASETSIIAGSLEEGVTFAEQLFSRIGNINRFLEQAGVNVSPTKFLLMTLGAAAGAAVVAFLFGAHVAILPVAALIGGGLPFFAIWFKRKQRMSRFAKQLPEALELVSRALRAGHSLAAGFSLVGEEMSDPVGREFTRCYEEQNLGIPLEEALEDMTERVPNLDLRFFATAVILQRQTGGDLAEILDKIGTLVRERFKIWGQIQALTGEGRLSGIVLLALPPVLFLTLFRLNPDYCMILFDDPMGQQMLAVAVVMQFLGAVVIKKIISIKV